MAKMNVGGTFLHFVWVAFLLVSTVIQLGKSDEGKFRSVTFNPFEFVNNNNNKHFVTFQLMH